jgi:hypothetical protein
LRSINQSGLVEQTTRGKCLGQVTRVNTTNVLDEGLRIGEVGRQMNSKVKSVKQGAYRK